MEVGFVRKEKPNYIDIIALKNDFTHILITGPTGSGKTTCGINHILEERIKDGYGILVYDEKGKEHKVIKHLASLYGREDDIVEIGKVVGSSFNILDDLSFKQMRTFAKLVVMDHSSSYWDEGSRDMLISVISLILSIKNLIRYSIEIALLPEDQSLSIKEEGFVFEITKDPLTVAELGRFFSNEKMFVGLSNIEIIFKRTMPRVFTFSMDQLAKEEDGRHLSAKEEKKLIYLRNQVRYHVASISGYVISRSSDKSSAHAGDNGLYSIIFSGLSQMISNRYINDKSGEDISAMLNRGKIIILDTEPFSGTTLSIILAKTLSSLAIRSKLKNKNNISVFIDEGNRVFSKNDDFYIDILREAKVELIVSTQNEEQMIHKFGEVKWNSFVDNFGTKMHFLGFNDENRKEISAEILHLGKKQKVSIVPKFIEEQTLLQAELLFQRERYAEIRDEVSEDEIIVFDEDMLLNKMEAIAYNVVSSQERFICLDVLFLEKEAPEGTKEETKGVAKKETEEVAKEETEEAVEDGSKRSSDNFFDLRSQIVASGVSMDIAKYVSEEYLKRFDTLPEKSPTWYRKNFSLYAFSKIEDMKAEEVFGLIYLAKIYDEVRDGKDNLIAGNIESFSSTASLKTEAEKMLTHETLFTPIILALFSDRQALAAKILGCSQEVFDSADTFFTSDEACTADEAFVSDEDCPVVVVDAADVFNAVCGIDDDDDDDVINDVE